MSPARKNKSGGLIGMAFNEALARLLQTDKKELEDAFEKARQDESEAKRYAEERQESIRKGARRAPKRIKTRDALVRF
jgi:hypothetical protein